MTALWSKELDKNGLICGPGVPLYQVIIPFLRLAASSEVYSESRELVPRLSEVTCLSLHLSRVLHAKLPKQCSLILTVLFFLSSGGFLLRGNFFPLRERCVLCVCCVELYTLCNCWDTVRLFPGISICLTIAHSFQNKKPECVFFFFCFLIYHFLPWVRRTKRLNFLNREKMVEGKLTFYICGFTKQVPKKLTITSTYLENKNMISWKIRSIWKPPCILE